MRGCPIQQERDRRASGRVLRLIANPKRIASAADVTERAAQMWCAGERDNALGRLTALLRSLASEGVGVWRAVAYLKSEIMGAEMDVRDVAPEVDYQAALQQLHDRAAAALPLLLAELQGRPDPEAMHTTALDVAEAAEWLMSRARILMDARRAELRRNVRVA